MENAANVQKQRHNVQPCASVMGAVCSPVTDDFLHCYVSIYQSSFICLLVVNDTATHLSTGVCSLCLSAVRVAVACHGNAGTENVYNGCRTNAAAEASYDTAHGF